MHALPQQLEPLHHAEAMLLVHNRQAQLLELHVFFKQRVRPDRYMRQPRRDQLLKLPFLPAGERSGKLYHHVIEARQQLFEVVVMLRRQDLRGRQHRYLIPVLDGDHRRLRRHDGLATAYVALQQPVHRPRRFHILRDFA